MDGKELKRYSSNRNTTLENTKHLFKHRYDEKGKYLNLMTVEIASGKHNSTRHLTGEDGIYGLTEWLSKERMMETLGETINQGVWQNMMAKSSITAFSPVPVLQVRGLGKVRVNRYDDDDDDDDGDDDDNDDDDNDDDDNGEE
ncbi:hypothetical protein ElyMa_000173700 [Elysia marginata]|uniref:Uncharacterized protein n=1 Tax=Elysia marginata TaxID=1093978 RepID=A0AAV4EUN8_9GAST|nr:hypothetical protein ElyMa_000173700 [Elysia marginata]